MKQLLAFKTYCVSSTVVGGSLLFVCLLLGYDARLLLFEAATALLLSLPSLLSLQLLFLILRSFRCPPPGAWILLLAFIPLFSFLPAVFLEQALPGKIPVLGGLALLGSYAGILSQATSLTQTFQNLFYES
jgi:hypothetical protein